MTDLPLTHALHALWTGGGSLAQTPTAGGGSWVQILIWSAILIVLVTVGGVVLLAFRRRLFDSHEPGDDAGTVMEELRRMRDRGEISDDEFRQTRAAMIERQRLRDGSSESPTDRALGGPIADRAPPIPRDPTEAPLEARPGFDLTGEPLPERRDPPPAAGENPE